MSVEFIVVLQIAVGAVFALSAAAKLRHFREFTRHLAEYGVLFSRWTTVAALVIVAAETLSAVSHLTGWVLELGAPMTIVFLATAIYLVMKMLKSGKRVRCLCFGVGDDEISVATLVRLGILIASEILLIYFISKTAVVKPVSDLAWMPFLIASTVAAATLIVVDWIIRLPGIFRTLLLQDSPTEVSNTFAFGTEVNRNEQAPSRID